MTDCLFCKIVAGDIPAEIVAREDTWLAFRDINPQAPVHILLIPIRHDPHAAVTAKSDLRLPGILVQAAHEIAQNEGIADDGYRLVFNSGAGAGQTVFHTHLHLLGGRPFSWPPG